MHQPVDEDDTSPAPEEPCDPDPCASPQVIEGYSQPILIPRCDEVNLFALGWPIPLDEACPFCNKNKAAKRGKEKKDFLEGDPAKSLKAAVTMCPAADFYEAHVQCYVGKKIAYSVFCCPCCKPDEDKAVIIWKCRCLDPDRTDEYE